MWIWYPELTKFEKERYDFYFSYTDSLKETLGNVYPILRRWTFDIGRWKQRLGCCSYSKKEITVSKYVIFEAPIELLKQIILHEIAHVIAWPGEWHGKKWKWIANLLGIPQEDCKSTTNFKSQSSEQWKYQMICPNCKALYHYHKRPHNLNKACWMCCKNYNNWKYTEKYKLEKYIWF